MNIRIFSCTWLCFFLLALFFNPAQLMAEEYDFHFLTSEDGLPQNSVKTVLKDSRGFIWIGTRDGLARYDGTNVFVYKNSPYSENSISNNSVWQLREDKNGCIWIGTERGLNKFDPESDTFRQYLPDILNEGPNPALTVGSVITLYENEIWFAVFNVGLFRLDLNTESISLYKPNNQEQSVFLSKITHLEFEDDQNFLISCLDGKVYRYNKNNHTINEIASSQDSDLAKQKISTVHIDSHKRIWIGTHNGVYFLNPGQHRFEHFDLAELMKSEGESHNLVEAIEEDDKENIWIGTRQGLIRIDSVFNIRNINDEIEAGEKPHSAYIRCLHFDNDGIMWAGTIGNGILFLHEKMKNFRSIAINTGLGTNSAAYSTIIDSKGFTWVGNENGLYKLNGKNEVVQHFSVDLPNERKLSDNFVTALAEDKSGRIWIGTDRGGVNVLNPETRKIIRFGFDSGKPGTLKSPSVWQIFVASDSTVWIGTGGGGLSKYIDETNGFFSYLNEPGNNQSISSNNVGPVFEDNSGFLWIGTSGGGLNRFDPKTNTFKHYDMDVTEFPLAYSNTIVGIEQGKDGNIWIATDAGLFAFNTLSEKYVSTYPLWNINSSIRAMVSDNHGNIWLSTSREIARFHPNNGHLSVYDQTDGFRVNEFLSGSVFKSGDGKILFGGINGIVSFYPDEIIDNKLLPQVVLNEFRIFNTRKKEGLGWEVHRSQPAEIELKPNQTIVSFSFSALNYINSSKNNYSYKLEGFDPEWSTPGKVQTVTYTKLPPDTYTFRVKASNNDNVWNEEGLAVKVTVVPPFWKTWWFRVGISLFWVLIFYAWYQNRIAQIKSRKFVLERQVQERTAQIEQQKIEISKQAEQLKRNNEQLKEHQDEILSQAEKLKELDKMKSSFFTNLTHEFRTPLTLILSPIEKILDQKDINPELENEYRMIFKNAHQLLKLINQLLELAKAESGFIRLHAEKRNITEFIQTVCSVFIPKSKKNSIDFRINLAEIESAVYFDPDKLEKILINLLANAFQFTPKNGIVEVSVHKPPQYSKNEILTAKFKCESFVEIIVRNSGTFIPPEKLPNIFNRFYSSADDHHEMNHGTGIGLALTKQLVEIHKGFIRAESDLENGTCFIVVLPIEADCFEVSEIVGNSAQEFEFESESLPVKNLNVSGDYKLEGLNGEKNKPQILLVEDNDEMREYLAGNLRKRFQVFEAANGKAGFELALEHSPNLIISDIMMPEMDGFQLCRRIKADERINHIPVLLLTAKVTSNDQIEGYEVGADAYVLKPFSLKVLESRIINLLEQRKKLRQLFSKRFVLEPTEVELQPLDKIFLEKAIKIVEDNMDNPDLNVEDYASELCMSRTQLYNKIKAVTDMPVHNFILSIRLKRAAQLLQKEEYNIAEIAIMTGFNNPKYFSKLFKKQFNLLPTEYRKEQLAQKNTQNL